MLEVVQTRPREDLLADGCLGVPEAAEFIGLGKSTLYLMMDRGELPYVKIGRRRLIPKRVLVRMAAQHLVGRDDVLDEFVGTERG